ncbi:MAG TPA: AAA family ATPase, partial [Thermomonospora sp.]|nr:AAA family ATPase [Thermomonospora sp.]
MHLTPPKSDTACPDDAIPMVGRGHELGALRTLTERARNGHGGALAVTGETGAGKTRLLTEATRLAGPDHLVLRGAGVPAESSMPYAGLHQLLQPLLEDLAALPKPQADAVRGAFGQSAPGDAPLLVALATLTLLSAEAARGPVLVLVDDAQHLDPETRDALVFVARRLSGVPAVMLIAARDFGSGLPGLRLGPLGPADTRLLAERALGTAPRQVVERLAETSGGLPLAVLELAGALPDGVRCGGDPFPEHPPCGERLLHAFGAQVACLPAATRRLLLVAAADDRGEARTTLAAAERLGVDPAALAPAEHAGLVSAVDGELRFRYGFLRSVVYTAASLRDRQAAHRALADVLADTPYRQALHLAAATHVPDEEVARRIGESAAQARRSGGLESAANALERAAALTRDPLTRARFLLEAASCAWQAGRPLRARELQRRIPQASEVARDPGLPASLALLRGAVSLTGAAADSAMPALLDGASRAAASDPELAGHLLILGARVQLSRGDRTRVADLGRRLTGLPLPPRHPVVVVGTALTRVGSKDLRRLAGLDQAVTALLGSFAHRGPALWPALVPPYLPMLGGTAHEAFARTVDDLRAQGATGALPLVSLPLVEFERTRGRWEAATALAHEMVALALRVGQRGAAARLRVVLALLAAARGDVAGCRDLVDRALRTTVPDGDT